MLHTNLVQKYFCRLDISKNVYIFFKYLWNMQYNRHLWIIVYYKYSITTYESVRNIQNMDCTYSGQSLECTVLNNVEYSGQNDGISNYISTKFKITFLKTFKLHFYKISNYIFTKFQSTFLQNFKLHFYKISNSIFTKFQITFLQNFKLHFYKISNYISTKFQP